MVPVTTALCILGKSDLCFTNEERIVINLTIKALKPFEEATREVSAEKHISISKVIPLVSLLLRATAASEHQGCSFATELAQQCHRRFRGVETIHSLAASTFLDMRLKHLAFRDKDHVETVKKRLLSEMQDVHLATSESATAQLESTSTSVLRKKQRLLEEKMEAQRQSNKERIKEMLKKMDEEMKLQKEEFRCATESKLKEKAALLEMDFREKAERMSKEIEDFRRKNEEPEKKSDKLFKNMMRL
ncbi:hypothetical protein E1301_Tti020309 [Triplophysa tibetana]|uniref:Guanylate-binding protein/Atlastin C-terminal domain-containing protein n=1 Tax=Triplophysa tibetana TaxID=1572043 RepID=A0A5A9P0H4_9TELE|nr:hypothetical protein E1301_Tti020309 [Triplophysa tibetana]